MCHESTSTMDLPMLQDRFAALVSPLVTILDYMFDFVLVNLHVVTLVAVRHLEATFAA